ncbi:signal peptidase I [Agromyces bauzanensis]
MSTGTTSTSTTASITTDVASTALAWILALAAVAAGALLINRLVAFTIVVRSESMRPAFEPGDLLLTTRVHDPVRLRRGDVVVFRSRERGGTLVKRLIGLPGDRVEFVAGGATVLNGERLAELYARHSGDYRGTFVVPDGGHLFLGDNRGASDDARSWTHPYVDAQDILGVVRLRLFPIRARRAHLRSVDA